MTSRPFGTLDWARRTPGIPALLAEIRHAAIVDAPALPQSWFARLVHAGFGRLRIPVAEGGLGGDVLDLLDAYVAIAAADSNLAQSWRTHILATERHVKTPPGALRDRWIGRIAAGAIIGGGWTEADGSGPDAFTTRLSSSDDGLVLTGRKFYSTGSRYADWLEYSAVDDEGALVIAALPADSPGVSLLDDWSGFGQRATASGTTVLESAPVDPGDVAPFDSQHLGTPGWQQLTLLAVLVGIGQAAQAAAASTVERIDRAHGSAPPAALEEYGRISALVASARSTLESIGRLSEDAHRAIVTRSTEAAELADTAVNAVFQAQATIVEQIVDATDRVMTLPAALGDPTETARVRRTFGLDRFWRNAQTIATHNPVLHRLRSIADRELYGLDGGADPDARAVAVAARERPLDVVRIDPALSAALAADPSGLDRVACAFAGRDPVLFEFGERPGLRFDPAAAIAVWLHRFPTAWFGVRTDRWADAGHPYNLARRIASLEQLSGGRIAWIVTDPESGDAHRDYLRVVEQLWRSWPRESIAADGAAAHFAETDAIRRINADGAFPVAGPLNVPSSPQHLPVVVATVQPDDPHRYVDLLLHARGWTVPDGRADAAVLAAVRTASGLAELLAIAETLPASSVATVRTLRERLRLPAPALAELPGADARFPRGDETEAS